jgi:uncharacterized protein (PEP-CTERM system associated)
MATTEVPPPRLRSLALAAACALGVAAAPAHANLRITPEINATFTATDNGGLLPDTIAKSDVIVDVAPRVHMVGLGASYKLDADIGADMLEYANKTAPSRILPSGHASLVTTLADRWLYLDTNLQVEQSVSNPFGVQSDVGSSANRITTSRYTVAPFIDHEFTPNLSLYARAERRWVKRSEVTNSSFTAPNAHEDNQSFRLVEHPQPFGYSLEYDGQRTTYQGDTVTVLDTRIGRAVGSYALQPDTVLSLVAGRERNEFSLSSHTDSIYGLRFKWTPSERTLVSAEGEHRFFGTGWDVEVTHRSPFVALAMHAVRRPSALSSQQLLGGEGTTAGLLDAMLTTRYPDPLVRSQLVQQLISQLGLPPQLRGAVEVFSDAPQLEQGLDFTGALRGRVTTFTANVYERRYVLLARPNDPLSTLLTDDAANQQVGLTLTLSRRLDSQTSGTLVAGHSRLHGLGAHSADVTNQSRIGLNLTRQLGPQTSVNAGVRRQVMTTTVVSNSTMHESAVFVGLGHRF